MLEGSFANSGPTTVGGAQSKDFQRIINWVADAWRELQGSRNWSWQWESASLTVLAATNTSSVAQSIAPARYDTDSAFIGTAPLDYYEWADFRQMWPLSDISDGTPVAWSIRPNLAFVVNSRPTADTTIIVERYVNPSELTLDADIPGLPSDLHMYLVWAALMKYAARDEAGSLYSTSEKFAGDIKRAIYERCLPQMTLGGSLC